MKRAWAAVAVYMLAACASRTPQTHRLAYVDVARIDAPRAVRTQIAAYDREIAALQATQAVPQLRDTRGVVWRQARVVTAGAREAKATLASLRVREPSDSGTAYRAALTATTANALTAFRASLNARVASAYAARAAQFQEHEAELAMKLERANADRRLILTVKLQNLKAPYADRPRLRAELNAMDAAIARRVDAMHAADQQHLAAYRARLDARAARQYASTSAGMARKERANWLARNRVAREAAAVQAHAPPLALASFRRAGNDIAHRFDTIANADTHARGESANEIVALERARGALAEEYRRSVLAAAAALARARGLQLTNRPARGAVDLTADVARVLAVSP